VAAAGPTALTAREALTLGTRGGAGVLGRADIGSLEPGKRADFAVWRPTASSSAEPRIRWPASSSPQPHRVDRLVVEGEDVVRGGALVSADEAEIARAHRVEARRFAQ
jgi:cytosine/adenosine deaminase-related metal-dependent hydrolase